MTDEEVDALLERYDQTAPDLQRKIVAHLVSEYQCLATALAEMVKLQAHYAKLLNEYDQGERVSFPDAQTWLDRMADLGKIPHRVELLE